MAAVTQSPCQGCAE